MPVVPKRLSITRVIHSRVISTGLSLLGLAVLALLISRLPLKWSLLGLGSLGVMLVLTIRPMIGLYLLAFSIPFGSLYPISIGSFVLDASDLLVALITFSWLLEITAFRRDRLVGGGWLLALGVFGFTLACGLLPAANLPEAFKELLKWVEFSLVMAFIVNRVKLTELEGVIIALLLAGILQGLYGISQFLAGNGPEAFSFLGRYTRAYGTFEQPNPFGGYMGLLLPVAYAIVLFGWRHSVSAKQDGYLHRYTWWLALASVIILLTALLMSGSRGALLGLIIGAFIVALVALRKIWPLLVVALIILLAAGPFLVTLIPQAYVSRVTDIFTVPLGANLEAIEITDANFSLIERAAHWQAAWVMFSMHPWFGVGLGQYATVYPLVALPRWANPLGHAHNYILNTLAEGGIFGLIGYLTLQLTLLGQAVRTALERFSHFQWLGLGAVGTWFALFGHNLVDNLYVHHLQLIIAILFGLVILVVKKPMPDTEVHP